MKNSKLPGIIFIGLGIIFFAAAFLLIFYNWQEDKAAEEKAQQALELLEARQTESTTSQTPASETSSETTDSTALVSESLENYEYVGYLIFPSLNRKLPVIRFTKLKDLKVAPCLEKGSPLTDDAVISAHNYSSHFGPLRNWSGGEEVIFSTLDGQEILYTVSLVDTIEATDGSAVMDSEHDLILYTCTTGGEKRVMIACDRTE